MANTPNQDNLQGTGEEWRAMDVAKLDFKSSRHDAVVAAAKQSIEKVRQCDCEIRLTNAAGQPVAHAEVEIEQLRGAFEFGDQTWELDRLYRFDQAHTDRGRYWKQKFAGALTAANALSYWTERDRNDGPKYEDIQGEPVTRHFWQVVDWANAAGLTVKGHPLFWSIDKCVPAWVKRYDVETQMKFAEVRVRNLVAAGRGRVKIWDAVNEPMWEPAFENLKHRHWPHIDPIDDIADYIEPVLTWCRQEDPDALYLINDYGMELDPPNGPPKDKTGRPITAQFQRERFLSLMRELQQRGTPPDGLGMQSHTGGWQDAASQHEMYDQMSSAGIPVHVTEFWASISHLTKQGMPESQARQLQADYVADYMTVAFGHPKVASFFFWGFMADAVQFRDDYSGHEITPMYERVLELVKKTWRTHLKLKTDADGKLKFRGFYGDYALRYAISPKATSSAKFSLTTADAMPLTLATRH
jgi:GH35 family endo-1,4-beta-xylanase